MYGSTETDFTVQADPDVETFIIDHAFRLLHRGMGTFPHRLPSGLYKFKYRRGQAISEELVEIPANPTEPVKISPKSELAFTSSAPLPKTRGAAYDHLAAAKRMSEQAPINRGDGSKIFIFIRLAPDAAGSRADVAEGLTLHDAHGQLLVDLSASATRDDAKGAACAAIHVSVNPGAYRLRHASVEDTLEMTVIACPGWQTQVFLMHGAPREERIAPTPLASASVMMSMNAFDPGNELLRLADASLIALREKRATMSQTLISELLADKYENPMLGIYGAHALQAKGDSNLLARVVSMLEMLIPGHPDVAALRLGSSPGIPFDMPPMLRSSWRAIVEASLTGEAVLPPGSLASCIPSALLEGTPWLIWAPDELLDPKLTAPRDITSDLEQISAVVAKTHYLDELPIATDLTPAEEELFAFLSRRSRLQERTRSKRTSEPEPFDERTLARTFGTTVTHVQVTVTGLAGKLRERTAIA